jgi:hypothetical protein
VSKAAADYAVPAAMRGTYSFNIINLAYFYYTLVVRPLLYRRPAARRVSALMGRARTKISAPTKKEKRQGQRSRGF